ncbi:MAG: DMT family transporter [Hyphomicrobiales bacterium]
MTIQTNPAMPTTTRSGLNLHPADFGLYAAIVFFWGASWYPLKLQVGIVAPHVSLTWRFMIAATIMMVIVALTKRQLRFSVANHLRFIALGIFLFSSNFACFYYGALYIPSGLLSVVFSLASIINMALALLIYRQAPPIRVLVGATFGVVGIAALFWPEIATAEASSQTLFGLTLCVAGTVFFCIGNLFSASVQRSGISVMSGNAWGMVYGACFSALIAFVSGAEFIIEPTASYILSLIWLAVTATVFAFWCYLTLLGRIGSARAGYATVMFPIVALLVSTVFESYQWSLLAGVGVALALAGNALVLSARK